MLKNLGETLERAVADRPDAPACSFLPDGEQRADGFSFAELDRRARALAGHLHEAGLTGSRVLLVHPPGPEFVVALFACFYAGVTAVPVVPPESRYRAARERLEGIAAACSPAAQLTTSLTGPALEPAVLTSLATDVVPAGDASFTPLDVAPESTAILQFTSGATRAPRGVVLSHRSVLANLDLMDDRYERRRGVVTVNWLPLHHDMGLFGGLLRSVVMVGHCVLMPPGAMLRKPIRWWRAVVDHSATVTGGPDFGFDLSVRRTTPAERDSLDLSGLSVVYTGAEPVRAATLERFAAAFAGAGFDRRVFLPVYGLAEATLMVSGARVPDPPTVLSVSAARLGAGEVVPAAAGERAARLVSCGPPGKATEVRIVDPDSRQPVEDGRVGEIWVRGDGVGDGYWGEPELTEDVFGGRLAGGDGARYLRTGDLGGLLDGDLVVTGRRKEVVIVAGANIYPHDVEDSARAALTGVRAGASAAFGLPDGDQERLVLVQEVRLGPDADRAGIADGIRSGVAADHGVAVSRLVLVAPGQVPKTSSGKVQRGRCRQLLLDGALKVLHDDVLPPVRQPTEAQPTQAQPTEAQPTEAQPTEAQPAASESAASAPAASEPAAAPDGEIVSALGALVADLLVLPAGAVEPDRPLTALGMDSLRAAELQEKVQQRWGVEVDVVELLGGITPAELATLVGSGAATPAGPVAEPAAAPAAGDAGDPFPLTDLQQAYLAGRTAGFELGGVGTHAYLEFTRSGLDAARAAEALRLVAERHDMMRAVILPDGTQRVLPPAPHPPVEVDDLRAEEDPAGRLARTRDRMSRQVHDPYTGPVFEVRLSLLAGGDVRLHLSFDLLILDARSILQVLTEWGQVYAGAELPPVTGPSFRDFVLARRDREERGSTTRRAELRRRAAELVPGPGLPLAADPATVGQPRFGRHSARLDRDLLGRLRLAAQEEAVTLAALLGAAFAEVLALHGERRPFTLTLTSFERPAVDVGRQVAGEFTSLLLVGVEADQPSFGDRVRGFSAALLREMAGRDINGVALLREYARTHAGPGGGPPRPVAPVVFTSLLEDAEVLDWLGEQEYAISQTPQVWLDHQVMVHRGELVLLWDAVEDLFPPGFLAGMFTSYQRLLRAVADRDRWARPGRELAGLPPAPAGTPTVTGTGVRLDELVLHSVRDRPGAEAVVAADRRLTYQELDTASRQVAAALAGAGVERADLVAVALPKGWQQIPAVLGTLRAGAAYVPVDPDAPPARLAELLADSGARVVLTTAAVPLPAGARGIVVDELWAAGSDRLPAPPDRAAADLAYVIYTSGSTGRPKGVAVQHAAAANTVTDVNSRYGVGPDDRALGLSPLTFDLSVYDLFGLLGAGGGLVLPDAARRAEPAHWAELLRRERVTIWNSVPALLRLLHQDRGADLDWAKQLRLLLLSGDWIPVDFAATLRRELPDARLVSLGGATEGAIWSVLHDVEHVEESGDSIPYGRAMRGQQAYVLDSDWGPRPTWVPGPLYLAGAGLAREYWRDEAKTAASFVVSPVTGQRLYRTGDVARLRPDGTLELLGREDDQLKIQGHRIEPAEVEAALVGHPDVTEAVVGGVGPRDGVRRLVAAVRATGPVTGEEVRGYVARTLPRYLVPDVVRVVERLPLTPNGKVDRAALLDGTGPATAPARTAVPATARTREIERELLRIVGEISGAAQVDTRSRLFDLELSSVHLIRLATDLERAFGTRPSLEQLYQLADLGELVDFYAASPEPAAAPAPAPPAAAVVLDETARAEVKRQRRERPAPTGTGLVLRLPEPDPERAATLLRRRTERSFEPAALDVRALAGWLECLREHDSGGGPRYAWASAGGAYPIDFYLQVHNPLAGLSAGVYRYDPRGHDLTLLTTEPVLTPAHHWSENRRIHAEAAFALLLVADLTAITPLYGDLAERFCLLEAGGIGQLLASHGDGVGVCPVGFVDFAPAAEALGLPPEHRLVYTLLGGAPAAPSAPPGPSSPPGPTGPSSPPGPAGPAGPASTAGPAGSAGTAGPAQADADAAGGRRADGPRAGTDRGGANEGGRPGSSGAAGGPGRPRPVPVALPTDELRGHTRLRLPAVRPRDPAAPVRSLLLTGATGYLGRQLVVELLARTDVTVHALATAADAEAARARVLAAVRDAGLALPPGTEDRLVGVAGDLARPRLGLSVSAYELLAEEVGAVYHSAAKVRWLRSYEDLEEVNVTGTRRVLDLVADGPPKRLVHVSTLAVFPFGGSEPVTEEQPLDHGGLLYGGYPQSKWVAEKLVAAAAAQGLDTVVLRPGSVTGASGSGVFNPRSFVELLLSTVVGLGWAPLPSTGEDVPVDLVPVDYAAAASVALTLSPTGQARGAGAYHLTNPAPLRLSALYDTLEELGYRVRREPFESWRDRLLDPAVIARTPLEPFADFLAAAMEEFLRLPPYSSERARRDLAGTGVECAPVDAALLRTYFGALHQHGLVPHAPAGIGPRENG